MNHFFNTTNEPDPTLFEVKARTQEQIILEIFRKYPDLTPSECHKLFPGFQVPLTSIRRAITNLATDSYRNDKGIFHVTRIGITPMQFPMSVLIKEAKLFKTDTKRIGMYGRPEYAYKIINRL
jgi:hypothetical protein